MAASYPGKPQGGKVIEIDASNEELKKQNLQTIDQIRAENKAPEPSDYQTGSPYYMTETPQLRQVRTANSPYQGIAAP